MRRMCRIGTVLALAAVAAACASSDDGRPVVADPGDDTVATTIDTVDGTVDDTLNDTLVTTDATAGTAAPPVDTAAPDREPHWVRLQGGRFVDTRTDAPFALRGVNLIFKPSGAGPDQLFAQYDPDWVDRQLDEIAALGFDTVRFFVDQCRPCTSDAAGVRAEFLDDLADLLARIEERGLVALPTSNDVPDRGFSDRLPCCEPFGGYRNSLYLSADGHAIAAAYWTELLTGVLDRGAPTHHVLAWQLTNEQFVLRDVPPLSLRSGTVTAADGREYDLADDAQVEQMVVESLRAYIDTVGAVVRDLDDGALVTMGFFASDEPEAGRGAGDNRWVVPRQVLEDSSLDFVDLHAYPGLGGTWPAVADAFGIDGAPPAVPIVLGEFGAFEQAYPDVETAAAAMARWQAGSCAYGFQGWLLWFWGAERDDEVYPVEIADAAIARATTPSVRPDPCEIGPYGARDLAEGRPVTASAEESADYGAARAVDGSDATWWSAGGGPLQWIEIDLAAPSDVARVEVLIGPVAPPGPQTHVVTLLGDDGAALGSIELSADAVAGDVLVADFGAVAGTRTVRVDTLAADGWVILHEVSVLPPDA